MSSVTSPLFTPVTIATAPEGSKPLLESIRKSLGFIPNLMATFANNPIVLQGYLALEDVFERGSFTPKERQIILLATSVENDCSYCTAAHSTIAQSFLYTSSEIVAAVLNGQPVPDAKLNALWPWSRKSSVNAAMSKIKLFRSSLQLATRRNR